MQGWKSCLQLTPLNLNHFNMVEDMGLKIVASRSTWIAFINSVPNIIIIYQAVQKLFVGHIQTDWWFDKPTFIFGK
jgi:hypothetical protein